ncbi:MAG: GNAT family N-acetyltransferase [Magnetococcales bacterium]|nr:GNAT family N-acetyltransferase [Magnetococcales bacterium]
MTLAEDEAPLTLRWVAASDCGPLLEWRNHPQSRSVSHNTDPISPSIHDVWFERVMHNPDVLLLIGERGGERVGMVRFDRLEPNRWVVSINLNPDFRGRRLGAQVLRLGIEWLDQRHPGGVVLAEIMESNPASQRIFSQCGFVLEHQDGAWQHWMRKPA